MPKAIRVDDLSSQVQQITLNGITLYLKIYFLTGYTSNGWYVDFLDQDRNLLYGGRRITAGTNLTYLSPDVVDTLGGHIFCVNVAATREPLTRDNFSTKGDYQLWYYTNEEIANATSQA